MHALTSTGCQLLTGQNSRDKIQELVPEWSQPCSSALALRGAGERKDSSLRQSLSGTCFWLRVAETTVSLVTQMSLLSIELHLAYNKLEEIPSHLPPSEYILCILSMGMHAHTHMCAKTHTHTRMHTHTHISRAKSRIRIQIGTGLTLHSEASH